jgi:putative spermidine/putrescine transport system substrate-binding protein
MQAKWLIGAALAAALAAPAAARDLTVVSWGGAYQDAQREVYFKPFMEAKKTKLVEESWDGGIGVLRAKAQGGANNWDLVQVEAEELLLGCEEGLYEKVDWAKYGGKEKFLPAAVNDCGVGAIVYNFIFAYDADKLKAGPKSWADFWDVQKFPGKRGMRKGAKTTLEIALMADGVPPLEVYKTLRTDAGVERAFKKLDQLKPHLVWWEKGSQPPQLLASGELAMTVAYNGRISAANKSEKKNFQIVWPNSIYTIDSWVIMKGSPNKAQAEDFIAFASLPENQKNLPTKITYGVTAKAATPLIDKALMAELPTAPDHISSALNLDDTFWLENLDKLNQRFNAWVAR